ncbi:HlyD family efflux transporter periplasmic adaptor subunit [Pseudomonas sp. ZM23]|uniref:HlyD family efflux transporter periplasmic adaptor subunit n=1 Tax=Pseudomonas triclosanedens TaxID=2961893 RepID=A0ABY7A4D6_9PSED|nr:HlyD family efflux transporter periplasmic adaptor subunit [Pseudomonas triclosanedens]MCP8467817.1 HlyD family efflux transporter periplasmic adaptor subunit [Pseudomonas triclosanedens]MCP8473784.1 HlyD family efflux transporter periplasmic adaptor subunit [Pseudomonas triclosanedens]MCP8479706.1 HlyD family efflux transporter periplasmic adaptor subunit [Pseudomonas triclosanedens]WAI51386.1 HlyD family efflux transporter periplasmic adaptor subunit [Pseudomonas triclosanedens]
MQRLSKTTRGSRRAAVFIVLASLGLIGTISLSAWVRIDEIVHASGRIVAVAGTQVIQPADMGIISAVLVKEGDRVEKGQLLVELQRARAQASNDDSQGKVIALKATLARLQAEVFSRPLQFPPEVNAYPEFVRNQTELFTLRQRALKEAEAALEKNLRPVRAELALMRPLLNSKDVGKSDVLRLEHQQAELEGQLVNLHNKYFQDAQTEMTKAEEDLNTREQELADRHELLEHTRLVAPMSGVVRNIDINTVGASVRPGDVIMQIVPGDGELVFEAKLRPADVAYVRKGAPASVKLDAYDYSIFGVLKGQVTFVSPDALTEKTARGEEVYYRIRISLKGSDRIPGTDLQPGITGQVDVRTGNRTVLNYLIKPITKTISEAMTER